MSFRNLRRLGDRMWIPFRPDEEGFIGRECPEPECEGYFKVKPGTGLSGEDLDCHCPYCGFTNEYDAFTTEDQFKYAQSTAVKQFQDALRKDMKEWDRQLRRTTRRSFVQLKAHYKGRPHPIHYYREQQLETKVACEACTLEYAIYGVFAYCPDCGTHNSLQILNHNLDLAEREIALAGTESDPDFADYLVADALENAVSAFDGFGRETCGVHAASASDPGKAQNISFQNLKGADRRLQNLFGFNLAAGLASDDREFVCRCFQKRHLFVHKAGVVDQAYLNATGDPNAVLGRKIPIAADDVTCLIRHLRQLGSFLVTELSGRKSSAAGTSV
jgi:hypothetical protein